MLGRLARWIDDDPGNLGPTQRTRARVQHFVVLLLVLLGSAYAMLFAILGLHFAMGILAVAILVSATGLLTFTRRGDWRTGGLIISIGVFVVLGATLVARGGMGSNAAGWLLVAPLVAFVAVGPRHGVVVGASVAVSYVSLWGVEQLGVPLPAGLPTHVAAWMPPVDHASIAIVFFVLLWTQTGVWDRIIDGLDIANHQLEDEVSIREAAEREAQDAAHGRYTFLATMSHEIRTPLNGVLGLAEILLHSELDHEQHQLVSTVHGSGELLRAILDDVLDFSKIDSGRLEIEREPLNLRALCRQVERLWVGPAAERGIELELVARAEAPTWVQGDANKLRQILGNLVSNAVKFTDTGHVNIVLHAGPDLVIDVADTGIGLEETALARIFEPFRQAESATTRRFGGTGLGLAICRRLAEAMDGSLTVRSTVGQGTTFTLRLPLEAAEEPTLVREAESELRVLGRRVLVAEDNPVNQVVLRRALERHGIEVIVAGDGEQCVQAWTEHAPDMILMDCQMPVCDGYDATRRIRAAGGTLPIVAVTANTMPGDRKRSLDAGMDGHLGKPIRPDELRQTLVRWLSSRTPPAEDACFPHAS